MNTEVKEGDEEFWGQEAFKEDEKDDDYQHEGGACAAAAACLPCMAPSPCSWLMCAAAASGCFWVLVADEVDEVDSDFDQSEKEDDDEEEDEREERTKKVPALRF